MGRKIYTYTERENLYKCSFWQELKNIPQIVVSNDMKRCLKGKDKKGKPQGIFKSDRNFSVASFDDLKRIILSEWNKPENKYLLRASISRLMKRMIEKSEDEVKKNWLRGCKKNIGGMIDSIQILEEANVIPDDLKYCVNADIQLLKEVWIYLLENETVIGDFKKKMKVLENPDNMCKILAALFALPENTVIDKVVIHGFYYITPIQERVMDLMEKCGIELIFLFPYDSRYGFANEIWRKTYWGIKYENKWISEVTNESDPAGEIFEGCSIEPKNKIVIIEYGSMLDLANGIYKSRNVGSGIYSGNQSEANEILQDFYPEEYGKRRLLAYPIGKFIWCINDMWDEERNEIILTEKKLLECFSSGWLAKDGNNGKEYVEDVVNLMPFFRDCVSISEWGKRMNVLEDIHKNSFSEIPKKNDEVESRWQRVMGNPLGSYSQFSVLPERAHVVMELIRHMLFIAKELFTSDGEIQIADHIKKLRKIIAEIDVTDEVYVEEREIVNRILLKIQNDTTSKIKCFPEDAASALELYLNDVFDDGEIVNDVGDVVYPMFHTESANYLFGKAHICMCDSNSMPGGKASVPWPLSMGAIELLYEKTHKELLGNLIAVKNNHGLANRYFMYSALKCKEVTISWVSKINEKGREASPYIGLISEATNTKIWKVNSTRIGKETFEITSPSEAAVSCYKTEDIPNVVPKEAKMDFMVCPLRYLYGYLLDERPKFQSEFIQSRSIYSLVVAISNLLDSKESGLDEIFDNVTELFPGLQSSDKKAIYKSLTDRTVSDDDGLTGMDEEGGMYFSEERLRVHFPDWKSLKSAIREYGKIGTNEGEKEITFKKPSASYISEGHMSKSHPCSYCPNVEWCKYALFPRDKEKIYGKA
ncbi:hypothetical protein [Butyrivibrio sp. INlla16]|uniref:hypothetical protein n=1 Tax=Butyrivibrio sp. INlla16 TaxID=1520807 RepID=UPI000888B7D6|nr:hypothetical protein [Butyrivibrio sp. INlla16]SDB54021.1 hypothetical protein SAMN02910263_02734 [Butyrivibrio sp. INlla16]